jgi:diaminohydroxyphosphoribosylaminopyrimidine deaminase/5-amino-6-(5-phosphoribosylamino)uracil reductase
MTGDPRHMEAALRLAARARPSPNPPVGAVLVRKGIVVGRGFHRRAGGPHAEVVALREAGGRARGADLYVTLEPCNHQGRTPPCTEAILRAGVRRVFVGVRDPNPAVPGGGVERLVAEGVEVDVGLLADACAETVAPFAAFAARGTPFVTLKIAASLDGRIAARTGRSRWITGPAARRWGHGLRARHDAVLVGAGTLRADDPRLTARVRTEATPPIRIVLSRGETPIPPHRRVFGGRDAPPTLLVVPARRARSAPPPPPGARVLRLPAGDDGFVPEALLVARLARLGITSVLVEGGGVVFTRFLAAGLVDRVALCLAPRILGGPAERGWFVHEGVDRPDRGWRLDVLSRETLGDDLLLWGRPRRHGHGGG